MATFFSTRARYGLVIDPGGDIPVEMGIGHFITKRVEEIKARFSNHEFDTVKFFARQSADLEKRGWTLEKIDERMRTATGSGLDYHEIKPPTAEEKEKMADALIAQAETLKKEAQKLKTPTPKAEEAVETPKKGFQESCSKCPFVARGPSLAIVRGKLKAHDRKIHSDIGPTKTKLT
jgi:hypothetical protein|tara:strand:+ start:8409 stop:8939 length:531 start_codon:yes stop_codon:yes gene_type:complete